ncbi:hypothetical protein PG984_004406 [Apiospora sp. TS-2023a]
MAPNRQMEIQYQPFLKYAEFSDDPILVETSPRPQPQQPGPAKALCCQRRVLSIHIVSYVVVIITTSLFWILVMLSNTPSNNTATDCALSTSGAHEIDSTSALATHEQQQPRLNITTGATYLTCGNSTQEARSHGCQYDVLLNNWVPAPCYDADFVAEYEEDGSSAAFHDAALTQRVEGGAEALRELEFYYTSRRDHINHCAMMWRKQFAALFERRAAFDSVVANPYHTEHCSQYLLDAPERAAKGGQIEPTKTSVGFAGCWVRDDDKTR